MTAVRAGEPGAAAAAEADRLFGNRAATKVVLLP